MEVKEIEIRVLRPNNGEIDGLPRNPRKISKKQLEKLKKSLADAPEMLRLRELICVEHPDGPVVIAGNQRLEAAKALGWETLPCKVLPADTDPAKLRENIALAEAPLYAQSILDYAPDSNGARDYRSLAAEVAERIK